MSRKPDKKVPVRSLLGGGLVVAVVLVWVVWWQWDRRAAPRDEPAGDPGPTIAAPVSEPAEQADEVEPSPSPAWPADLDRPRDCSAVEAELARLCGLLDETDRVREAGLAGGACGLLTGAAKALASRPPVLEAELSSYASILSNVFHLFRVIGRERLELLAGALRENEELAEPMALALYRWAVSRESCARSGRSPLRAEVMYDYAGFLLHTLGGQAYLRRRSPAVEGLATFYALRVLDRAQSEGRNRHGLDARAEIRRARALLAGQPLVFRERYLEALDEMERRWEKK